MLRRAASALNPRPPGACAFGRSPQVLARRFLSEKVSGGHPEFKDRSKNEAAKAHQPRAPFLIAAALAALAMFWWAPPFFAAVAFGSMNNESSTAKAAATGGQSERGDQKREQMKREFQERKAREQAGSQS
mmetsp:Transcript_42997/g.100155  ORF Transcript_42997/g.100155 Transcript_42997/m.100155 type:complete len:131 (+) Transcript_42997:116-508(+)